MKLITQKNTLRDILAADVRLFEQSILKDSAVRAYPDSSSLTNKWYRLKYNWMKRLGMDPVPRTADRYLTDPLNDDASLFVVMMGVDRLKYMPYANRTRHARMIYLFDAWPKDYNRILRFVHECKITRVFVSARQSSEDLNKSTTDTTFYHVPEGIEPSAYHAARYDAKDIDVLALGRKYDRYHDIIRPVMEDQGRTYLYEYFKGEIIFPDREGLIDGLSRTKISICVPGSVTHPERSGHVETMTMRYLQSMVSKCLVVGQAPAEMISLFGYNPVINIDWKDPAGQIVDLLKNFHLHIPLIERNHREVLSRHTWTDRFQQIKRILSRTATKEGKELQPMLSPVRDLNSVV